MHYFQVSSLHEMTWIYYDYYLSEALLAKQKQFSQMVFLCVLFPFNYPFVLCWDRSLCKNTLREIAIKHNVERLHFKQRGTYQQSCVFIHRIQNAIWIRKVGWWSEMQSSFVATLNELKASYTKKISVSYSFVRM